MVPVSQKQPFPWDFCTPQGLELTENCCEYKASSQWQLCDQNVYTTSLGSSTGLRAQISTQLWITADLQPPLEGVCNYMFEVPYCLKRPLLNSSDKLTGSLIFKYTYYFSGFAALPPSSPFARGILCFIITPAHHLLIGEIFFESLNQYKVTKNCAY